MTQSKRLGMTNVIVTGLKRSYIVAKSLPMKRILLPTDFSKNALNAIEYAMAFFKGQPCTFYVLNVQKTSEYITDDLLMSSFTDTIYDSIVLDNKMQLKSLVKSLYDQYGSSEIKFEAIFENNTFVTAVQQAVENHNIDLIVMGTNGQTGASEVLFGSNTIKVLRHVNCPTLVIPENFTFRPIRNLLLSGTHKQFKNINEKDKTVVASLLIQHKANLDVLAIDEIQNESSRTTHLNFKDQLMDSTYDYHYVKGDFSWQTLKIASQLLRTDLKVVKLIEESLWKRILSGSQNSSVVYRSELPMLFL